MNKIYLVEFYREDYDATEVYAYCKDYDTAKKKEQELLDKIQNCKTLYFLEFDSDFDKDVDSLLNYESTLYTLDESSKVWDRINLYFAKYPELNFDDIKIIEQELL